MKINFFFFKFRLDSSMNKQNPTKDTYFRLPILCQASGVGNLSLAYFTYHSSPKSRSHPFYREDGSSEWLRFTNVVTMIGSKHEIQVTSFQSSSLIARGPVPLT